MRDIAQVREQAWKHLTDYRVIHLDDETALLFVAHSHRIFRVSADLGRRLETTGMAALRTEEVEEWNELSRAGALDPVNASRLNRSTYADGANLALNINLTGKCNLSCSYCFADGGDYGRIKNKMGVDLLDSIFEFITVHHTRSKTVRFELFGGEPLLNFPVIEALARRSDEFGAATGIRFIFRISTNLTVMPDGVLDMFRDRNFIVSISLDGGAETQNRNRPTKGGKSSYDDILENCYKVRGAGDNITMVARMTVVGSTPPLSENVLTLWRLNLFDYFQIYPGVTPAVTPIASLVRKKDDGGVTSHGTMEVTFLKQMADLLTIYPSLFSPTNRFRGVLEYEQIVQMMLEGELAVGHCSAGSTYFTFSPDSSISPCHRMVGDREFEVDSNAIGLTRSIKEWSNPVDSHPVCSQCWARYVCGGNCRQENFVATGEILDLNKDTCEYQKTVVAEVLRHVGRATQDYLDSERQLSDLFVSCGRPVVSNGRQPLPEDRVWMYFQTISATPANPCTPKT
jgi:radical SAM protein with 4Fe4S-binding SPASM domain